MYKELSYNKKDVDLISTLKKDVTKRLNDIIESYNLDYDKIRSIYHMKFLYETEHKILGYESRMYYNAFRNTVKSISKSLEGKFLED